MGLSQGSSSFHGAICHCESLRAPSSLLGVRNNGVQSSNWSTSGVLPVHWSRTLARVEKLREQGSGQFSSAGNRGQLLLSGTVAMALCSVLLAG